MPTGVHQHFGVHTPRDQQGRGCRREEDQKEQPALAPGPGSGGQENEEGKEHGHGQQEQDNAGRLKGRLLLIVGEMDTNVPPESTLRLADALIKAGKDFDLLVVPGMGHGSGGAYGTRRMQDFFVRHLHGVEPPPNSNGE